MAKAKEHAGAQQTAWLPLNVHAAYAAYQREVTAENWTAYQSALKEWRSIYEQPGTAPQSASLELRTCACGYVLPAERPGSNAWKDAVHAHHQVCKHWQPIHKAFKHA